MSHEVGGEMSRSLGHTHHALGNTQDAARGTPYDVYLLGVGGQGVVTMGDLIADGALEAGLPVNVYPTKGMAQRGGSVLSHVRWGQHVFSPMIKKGEVDFLVGFEQLETARAALRRAEAQLAGAETGAQDHEVRAPWDAVVSRVWVADGDYVAPRSPLVDIYDPASLRARIAVPELDARFLTAGTEVRVTADAWPGSDLVGRVERVYPELEPSTRTLTAEVEIDADVPLLSGMFVRVEVPLETAMGAVAIPSEAVLVGPDGEPTAFVMKGGKAALRRLTLGVEADDLVQVVDGVALGETLIVRGQVGLRDGMSVSTGRSSDENAGSGAPEPKADHEDN